MFHPIVTTPFAIISRCIGKTQLKCKAIPTLTIIGYMTIFLIILVSALLIVEDPDTEEYRDQYKYVPIVAIVLALFCIFENCIYISFLLPPPIPFGVFLTGLENGPSVGEEYPSLFTQLKEMLRAEFSIMDNNAIHIIL